MDNPIWTTNSQILSDFDCFHTFAAIFNFYLILAHIHFNNLIVTNSFVDSICYDIVPSTNYGYENMAVLRKRS